MIRPVRAIDGWPRLLTAAMAAAYCDEPSVDAFRRGIGKLWPSPKKIMGNGKRWLREDLDQAEAHLGAAALICFEWLQRQRMC
jgi:hypothetical protein